VFNKIARDAVCLVTNPGIRSEVSRSRRSRRSSPARSGTGARCRARGRPDDRRDCPLGSLRNPDAFQKLFMASSRSRRARARKASSGLVAQTVRSDRNAIGYVSLEFTRGLNDAQYQGVRCNLRNAKSGQYAERATSGW